MCVCVCHEKPQSVDFFMQQWPSNESTTLWKLAKCRANRLGDTSPNNQHSNLVDNLVDMAAS